MWTCPSRKIFKDIMKTDLKCKDCVLRRNCPRPEAKKVVEAERRKQSNGPIH